MPQHNSKPHKEWLRRLCIVLSFLASGAYLSTRLIFTLNFESPYAICVSLLLLAAECHGTTLMLLHLLQIWNTSPNVKAPQPLPGKTVDVLLPTYDEDAHLLRGSLQSMIALEYPHTVYLLDDKNRPEIKALAEEMGVEYIARTKNLHAKAGNINNALEQTDGEFVIIFDADHIPRKNFITRTLGYFQDESVAFVQTPHAFYNFDNYCSSYEPDKGDYWEEGQLFHNCVQVGKANQNAVVFCGSAAIFRRAALDEIGLVATETITEDMHTGLRLHAKGWKSAFVNERLVAAQAANDVTTYQSQRLRWGEGNLSILKHDNPLVMPGLTFRQRFHYMSSIFGWTSGFGKLLIYLMPILMLFTGVSPVSGLPYFVVLLLVAHVVFGWIALKVTGNGHFRLIQNEIAGMASFWIQIRAFFRAAIKRHSRFVVTSKRGGQSNRVFWAVLPQFSLFVLGNTAVAWGFCRWLLGANNDLPSLLIGTSLIFVQNIFAWLVIRKGLRKSDPRFSYRHQTGRIHALLSWVEEDGTPHQTQGICLELNECGTSLHSLANFPLGQKLDIELRATGSYIKVTGTVANTHSGVNSQVGRLTSDPTFRIGIEFQQVDGPTRDALWAMTMDNIVCANYEDFQNANADAASARKLLKIPCALKKQDPKSDAWTHFGILTYIDKDNFTLLSNSISSLNKDNLVFEMETPFGKITGETRYTQPSDDGDDDSSHIFQVTKFIGQGRGILKSIQEAARHKESRDLVTYAPDNPKFPSSRTCFATGLPSLAAILLFATICVWAHPKYVLLTRIGQLSQPTATDLAQLDKLTTKTLNNEVQDLRLIAMLRSALIRLNREEMASKVLEKALKLAPNEPGLILADADYHLEHGQFQKAYHNYQRLFGRWPRFCTPERVLSAVRCGLAIEQDPDEVFSLLTKMDLKHLQDPQLARECAACYLSLKRPEMALSLLKNGNHKQDLDVGILIVQAHAAQQDFRVALEHCKQLGRIFPDSTKLLELWGDCAFWSDDYTEAIKRYEQANALSTIRGVRLVRWADALLQLEENQRVLEMAEQIVDGNRVPSAWCSLVMEAATTDIVPPNSRVNSTHEPLVQTALNQGLKEVSPPVRLVRAVTNYLDWQGDIETAFNYLSQHESDVLAEDDLCMKSASLAYRLGKYEKALDRAEVTIALTGPIGNPLHREAQLLAARSLGQMNRHTEALSRFRTLIKNDPYDESIRAETAGVALAGGNPEETLRLCRENPHDNQSRQLVDLEITALANLQQWTNLVESCDHYLALTPNDFELQVWRVKGLIGNEDFELGATALAPLLSHAPPGHQAHLLFGHSLCWSKQYERSLEQLLEYQADKLLDPVVLFAANGCHSLTPDQQHRIQQLVDQLLSTPHLDPEVCLAACDFSIKQEEYTRVVDFLSKNPAYWQQNLPLRLRLARALFGDQQYELAGDHYDHILAMTSNVAATRESVTNADTAEDRATFRQEVLLAAARNATAALNPVRSAEFYRELIDGKSPPVDVSCEYAGVLLDLQRPVEALAVLPNYESANLSFSQKLLYADTSAAAENFALATQVCSKLLQQRPNHPDVLLRQARFLAWDKQYEESFAIWRRLMENSPSDLKTRCEYAGFLVAAGRQTEALAHYNWLLNRHYQLPRQHQLSFLHAIAQTESVSPTMRAEIERIEKEQQNLGYLETEKVEFLAYIHANLSEYNNAVELLQKVLKVHWHRKDLTLLLADMLHEQGRYAEAKKTLNSLTNGSAPTREVSAPWQGRSH